MRGLQLRGRAVAAENGALDALAETAALEQQLGTTKEDVRVVCWRWMLPADPLCSRTLEMPRMLTHLSLVPCLRPSPAQLLSCQARVMQLEDALAEAQSALQAAHGTAEVLVSERDAVARNLLRAEAELNDVSDYSTKMFRQVRALCVRVGARRPDPRERRAPQQTPG